MCLVHKVDELFIILFTIECLAILNCNHAQVQLSYQDIISLGASCAPDDTCVELKNDTASSFSSSCDCDVHCAKYGTCCIDSPNIQFANNYSQSIEMLPCVNIINSYRSVFGVNKCKRNWIGDTELKLLCETENLANFEDPLATLPVSNLITGTTYKNYFCALCNDVNDEDLVFWEIVIRGPSGLNHSALQERLEYDVTTGKWGIRNGGLPYMPLENVFIEFRPTESIDNLRECFPNLISTCHPDWTDNKVKEKCLAYMGRIYAIVKDAEYGFTSNSMFKNVHCAICNFAKYTSESMCTSSRYVGGGQSGAGSYGGGGGGSGMSFPLILDVNFKDGNDVGKINRCRPGEIDDPFSNQCRAMSCRKAGYIVKDGKCVPS